MKRLSHNSTHCLTKTMMTIASCAVVALFLPGIATAATDAPTIRLFPTTVLEDIRQTSTVAKEMETGLQQVIGKLEQQQLLYEQSKCDGAEGDRGCERIAKQLGATYLEMLNIMNERLPDMEHTVNNTRLSLEKRLRSELGKKMTPWALQENLLGNQPDGTPKATPRLRGRSGMRLSERFNQYYQLVARAGTQSDQSLAVMASDIYLDMAETSDLIARTREEINRATLMEQLNQSFGIITPEMMGVVEGVKTILFGEAETSVQIAGPPPSSENETYISPLEF